MKPGRIPCIVPFCRVTGAQDKFPGASEILCRKHWMSVPKRQRQFLLTIERKLRHTMDQKKRWRLRAMEHRAWKRIRRMVIERAAGI